MVVYQYFFFRAKMTGLKWKDRLIVRLAVSTVDDDQLEKVVAKVTCLKVGSINIHYRTHYSVNSWDSKCSTVGSQYIINRSNVLNQSQDGSSDSELPFVFLRDTFAQQQAMCTVGPSLPKAKPDETESMSPMTFTTRVCVDKVSSRLCQLPDVALWKTSAVVGKDYMHIPFKAANYQPTCKRWYNGDTWPHRKPS
jgi:hypothetical protein